MFIEAAESCGLDRNQDINGETQLGAGLYHVTQRDGKRCSSAAAYIKPVLDRENLTVQTRAHVTEIRFDGDRAVGVTYEQDGVEHTPDVTGEIVLSAGAFNSPQLLMLSGVGPADHLEEHGIDVRVDLPGVGQNLQDHLFSFVVYDRTDEVPPAPTTSNIGEAGGYMYVDEDEPAPDLQFHFTPIYYMEHGLANPPGDWASRSARRRSARRVWGPSHSTRRTPLPTPSSTRSISLPSLTSQSSVRGSRRLVRSHRLTPSTTSVATRSGRVKTSRPMQRLRHTFATRLTPCITRSVPARWGQPRTT